MTSATLSNKKKTKLSDFRNILIWSLKKHKALGIVYVSLLVFSSPVIGLLTSLSVGTLDNPVTVFAFASLSTVVTMIMTFIISVMMFDYLHNKRQADVFGSLPCTRRTLFFSRFTTGLAMIIVPYIINMLIVVLMSLGLKTGSDIFTVYIPYIFQVGTLVLLSVIASYSFTAFMAVCCGTTANTVLSTLLISFAYPIAISMLSTLGSSMIPGVNLHIDEIPLISNLLSPYGSSAGGIFSLTLSMIKMDSNAVDFLGDNWQQLVAWAILIAASFVGCFFLTKKRKTEAAQNSFAFKAPSVIIRAIATAAVGLLFGLIFTFFTCLNIFSDFARNENNGQEIQNSAWTMFAIFLIAFVIAAFLTHLIATVIFNKGFKGFAKSLISFAAVVLCVCLLYTSLAFGGFGADKYVPQSNEISSVEITSSDSPMLGMSGSLIGLTAMIFGPVNYSDYYSNGDTISCYGEKSISAATKLHEKIINNLNSVNPTPYYISITGEPKLSAGNPYEQYYDEDYYMDTDSNLDNPSIVQFIYHMKDGSTVERTYSQGYYDNMYMLSELEHIEAFAVNENKERLISLLSEESGEVTSFKIKSDWYGGNDSVFNSKSLVSEMKKALLDDMKNSKNSDSDSIFCKIIVGCRENGSFDELQKNISIPYSYKNSVKLLSQYGYTSTLNLFMDGPTAALGDLSSRFTDKKTGELSKEAIEQFFTLPDNISNDYLEDRTTKESDNSCPAVAYDMTLYSDYPNEQGEYTEDKIIDRSKLKFKVVYSDNDGNLYYLSKESTSKDFDNRYDYEMALPYLRDKNDSDKVYYPFVIQAYSDDEKLYTMPVNVCEQNSTPCVSINSIGTANGKRYTFFYAG